MGFSAARYWNQRYRDGRTSGKGSEGRSAAHKAQVVNDLIRAEDVQSIADWGVGDGTVLSMLTRDIDYYGYDISEFAIARLKREWKHEPRRHFSTLEDAGAPLVDLSLSFDVIFHCIDDFDYEMHLRRVFASSKKLVLIHSSDHNGGRTARHVKWRRFTNDVDRITPQWVLESAPALATEIGFHRYRKREA